jgi:hypothetical protein
VTVTGEKNTGEPDVDSLGMRSSLNGGDQGGEMRFLFLIHGDAQGEAALTPEERRAIVEEHMAYGAMLRERGSHVLGEALSGFAVTVRPGPEPLVTDGPFAETKEAVGGFYVVECVSREEAIELAGRAPQSPGVAVEVLDIAGA